MKFIFDEYSLFYMLEDFPRKMISKLWDKFLFLVSDDTIISEKETLNKFLCITSPNENHEVWCKENSHIFKQINRQESKFLQQIMSGNNFDFLDNKQLNVYRCSEGLPFLLSIAKIQERYFVYRRNKNPDEEKILKICDKYEIKYMEIQDFLMVLTTSVSKSYPAIC